MNKASLALETNQSTCCGIRPKESEEEKNERITIDFLYLDLRECDRCKKTNEQLDSALPIITQALQASGFDLEVHKIHVQNEHQAAALGFVVSPTIRVNHRDIQFNWRETPCDPCSTGCASEITCREWNYGGRWYTVPPRQLLIRAILREAYGRSETASPPARETTETPDNLKRFFAKQPCCETEGG